MGVDDGDPHPVEAVADGRTHGLAVAQLFADALEDEDVGVDAHADGQDHPRYTGQGERSAEVGHGPQKDHEVRGQCHHGIQAGQAVVDQHEHGEEGHARGRSEDSRADRVFAKARPHGELLEVLQGGGEGTRAQYLGQLVGLDRGEAAGDHPGIGDLGVYGGGRGHAAVEDDGEAAADAAAGLALELLGALRVQGELDVGSVGLGVDAGPGVLEVAPRDHGLATHQVEEGLTLPLAQTADHLHVVGHLSRRGLKEDLLRGGRLPFDELQGQLRGLLDHALGRLGIGDPRKLDQDLVAPVAVGGDHRLGHPELVHAALEGADGLLDRAVLDLALVGSGHLHEEPTLARLADFPSVAEEVLQDVPGVFHPCGLDPLHGEGGGVDALRSGEAHALARELVADGLHAIVDGGVQGVVHHHLHHEVHAPAQVEAELDLARGLPRVEGRPQGDPAAEEKASVEDGAGPKLRAHEAVGEPSQDGGEHEPEGEGVLEGGMHATSSPWGAGPGDPRRHSSGS